MWSTCLENAFDRKKFDEDDNVTAIFAGDRFPDFFCAWSTSIKGIVKKEKGKMDRDPTDLEKLMKKREWLLNELKLLQAYIDGSGGHEHNKYSWKINQLRRFVQEACPDSQSPPMSDK